MNSMFDRLRTDVRYGLRQLVRAPVFTIVAAFSIAVGIGVVVITFSIINSIYFRPLPLPDAERVHHVYGTWSRGRLSLPSYDEYVEFARSGAFETLAASSYRTLAVATTDQTEHGRVLFVSPDYFAALGIPVMRGRAPSGGDEREIVITDATWQWTFDRDPDVLGRSIRVSGIALTIVGVAEPRLEALGGSGVGWVTAGLMPLLSADSGALQTTSAAPGLTGSPLQPGFTITGRLRTGQTRAAAAAQLTSVARALQQARNERIVTPADIHVLTHRQSLMPRGERTELAILLGAVSLLLALVLALACINVTGLQLARAVARRHEIAVRLTLGASRARLLAQLLTESVLLALVGGALGFLTVMWGLRIAAARVRVPDLNLDWRVIAFATLASLMSALLFGLAPARQALRTSVLTTLQDHAGRERNRLRGVVIAFQVAVALVLLIVAFTGTRGLRLHAADAARRTNVDGLVIANVSTYQFGNDTAATRLFLRRLQEVTAATAGVQALTTADHIPYGNSSGATRMRRSNGEEIFVATSTVGGEFFALFGVPLIAGRPFLPSDDAETTPVALVNRAFANRFGRERIERVGLLRGVEVIGIVDDVRTSEDDTPTPHLYLLADQSTRLDIVNLVARVRPGSETDISTALARAFQQEFPDRIVPAPRSMRDMIAGRGDEQRVSARIALWIGALELLLGTAGLYGLLLYALAARTREVGIRLALGAAPYHASWAIIRAGLRYALAGAAAGIAAGIPISIIAARAMVGARATDPVPVLTAVACVLSAAAMAAVVPAWNAARVQPAEALRHE